MHFEGKLIASSWPVDLPIGDKNYKINFDYEQPKFDGGAKNGDRETEKAFLTRFQVSL